jgi:O-methyltransferase
MPFVERSSSGDRQRVARQLHHRRADSKVGAESPFDTVRNVDWKRSVNGGLSRVTGYKLVKAQRLVAPRPPRPPKPRRRALPPYYEDEARQIIQRVMPRTMTEHEKLLALIVATRYIVDRDIRGAIAECGVWRGGSMQAVAHTLLARGVTDRNLHLFDTFEGMPEPTGKDRRYDGVPASEVLASSEKTANVWAIASLEDVQGAMAETGYPAERIHLHLGLVEETIPAEAPQTMALLRLDTDWYDSTKHELEHLYDRVPSGGVVIFDDYEYWEGARQAVDEFLDRRDERLLLLPMASGRIVVKP